MVVSMDATKIRGRSKLLTCFKPIDDDDHELCCDTAALSSSGVESGSRRKKKLNRSFSAALKAVLFRTSLLKKSRRENSRQDLKLVKNMKKNLSCKPLPPEEMFRTNSDRSSLFSSNSGDSTPSLPSSSASSCSSHSRSGSQKIKRSDSLDFRQMMSPVIKQTTMKRDYGRKSTCYLEMCIFLTCLAVLVFWGKALAIVVCTSTLVLFIPGQRRSSHQLRVVESVDDFDSDEYKKKVIMEGLLERNRPSMVLQIS